MHLTIDWIDFRPWGSWKIADKVGDFAFAAFMKVLKRVRGTHLPVVVPELTMKQVNRTTKCIRFFWVIPFALCGYSIMSKALAVADAFLAEWGRKHQFSMQTFTTYCAYCRCSQHCRVSWPECSRVYDTTFAGVARRTMHFSPVSWKNVCNCILSL